MYNILYSINVKSLDKVKEYIDFIESCKGINLPDYTEKHHILPRSLFPKYEFDKDNLIELSAINHYKAHVLLADSYGGSMIHALHFMTHLCKYDTDPAVNYEYLRMEHARLISINMTEIWSDPTYKKETSNAIREATQTEEFKEKISITSKERWEDPEYRKMVNTNRDLVMQTDEYKSKMSDIQKERMKDPKLRAACGWNKGKGRPSRVCPHCKRSGNTLGFFKIHFNNCKIIRDFRLSFIRLHILQLETLKDPKLLDKELSSRYLGAFIVGFKHLLRNNYDNE